ncbi:hypothetical protein A2841_02160 [Candidatus Kaiserbacteria bacterium RIFCSPHIGHO2_01_FULL_48_10]|uniref:Uncharacterized protein n=1 Tax=Candidatus Kaiserbacteria bacterium RIFCSPHIGHO2_01_FULL_48_10 TaxID=1798476 RepID=A0A1F6C149_9BACT|nr:MAG: hypothetical protein A2841_02160 [Candidatus Kaiserbacteria bacterium RIFCSPHIGHO2_01_FULL_48_10]HLC99730.1 hypothetical protein [Patescibacteria group bacterium]
MAMVKRSTIFLAILFCFAAALWSALDRTLSSRIFYQPIIGILPFVFLMIWSGWIMARYGSYRILLVNVAVFSLVGTIPFFLMGVQDLKTWHLWEQVISWVTDAFLVFAVALIIGVIRIKFFKTVRPIKPQAGLSLGANDDQAATPH